MGGGGGREVKEWESDGRGVMKLLFLPCWKTLIFENANYNDFSSASARAFT